MDSIEHGSLLDEPASKLTKERGVFLVPTLYRLDWSLENAKGQNVPEAQVTALRRARDSAHASLRLAIKTGVPIVFGTDATVYPHGLNAREFSVLVDLGVSPLDAIRSATTRAGLVWQSGNPTPCLLCRHNRRRGQSALKHPDT